MSVITSPTFRDTIGRSAVPMRSVYVHGLSEPEVIDTVFDSIDDGCGGWIITLNLQHLHRCEHDPSYRQIVDAADLVVVDGMPLVWAAQLQKTPIPERIAGSSLVISMAEAAAEHGRSLYLLGGDPGTADAAAAALQAQFSGLEIAGTHCPPFGFEHDAEQMEEIRHALIAARPDIVYVGLGSPKQEQLIQRLREDHPATWWVGVGISFSFLCGDVHRAPVWIQNIGLEWIHRLVQEPRRLFKRYLVEGVPFAVRLLGQSFVDGLRSNSR